MIHVWAVWMWVTAAGWRSYSALMSRGRGCSNTTRYSHAENFAGLRLRGKATRAASLRRPECFPSVCFQQLPDRAAGPNHCRRDGRMSPPMTWIATTIPPTITPAPRSPLKQATKTPVSSAPLSAAAFSFERAPMFGPLAR